MKAFYFDVRIEGVALVYAEDAAAAEKLLEESGAVVAGNNLRSSNIDILSSAREEA